MSYRSNVKVMMGLKAFDLLKQNCLESKSKYVNDMVKDECIKDKNNSYILIGWEDCRWNINLVDVKAVEDTLEQLDDIVQSEPELLKDYFYKEIKIREDNRTIEETNDGEELYTGEFYATCDFSI